MISDLYKPCKCIIMAKSKLSFVTSNINKFKEVEAIMPGIQHLELDLPEIQSIDPYEVVRAKLKAAQQKHKGDIIVDDTSVELAGMNGFPGPFAKWMHDSLGTRKIYEIVNSTGNTDAKIRTIVGYSHSDGKVELFEGCVEGKITKPSTDGHGFDYDEIFLANGQTKTFAQLTDLEKNEISHRSKALKKLKQFLEES